MEHEHEKLGANIAISDFYTAAFLRAVGFKLIGINKSDPKRFRFLFENRSDKDKVLNRFFAGDAAVEARQFIGAIKELKSLMYTDAI